MIKRVSLLSVVLLSLITSCQSPALNTTGLDKTENVQINTNTKITGNVEFPNLNTFKTKATESDISLNATISIIYPPDHPGSPNKTLSTALTDQNGNFTLKTDFNKIKNEIFVIEASKRIGQAGNFLMSLRTLIKWTDNGWQSITKDSVTINTKTTALTAMSGLMGKDKVTSDDTIGTIINNSPTDIKHSNNLVIKATSINEVAELVQLSIQKNQDPVAYIKYEDGKFILKDPENVFDSFVQPVFKKYKYTGGYPIDVAVDSNGNVYTIFFNSDVILKADTNNNISVNRYIIPGGYSGISGETLNVDKAGNLYLARNAIQKIDTNGNITIIAGNGVPGFSGDGDKAINAQFNGLTSLEFDSNENIYIADYFNNRIRKIDTNGIVNTIAGNGVAGFSGDGGKAINAELNHPSDLKIDSNGNIYIADTDNNRIRKIDTNGIITTIAGNGSVVSQFEYLESFKGDGGKATDYSLINPRGIALDLYGNLYITSNQSIKKVNNDGIITTFSSELGGNINLKDEGNISTFSFVGPERIKSDKYGNLYVVDPQSGNVYKVSIFKEVNP